MELPPHLLGTRKKEAALKNGDGFGDKVQKSVEIGWERKGSLTCHRAEGERGGKKKRGGGWGWLHPITRALIFSWSTQGGPLRQENSRVKKDHGGYPISWRAEHTKERKGYVGGTDLLPNRGLQGRGSENMRSLDLRLLIEKRRLKI